MPVWFTSQIGWSRDGALIYGRYLSTSAPGYALGLDSCGGHEHDSYGYHYHTQVCPIALSQTMNPGNPIGLPSQVLNTTFTGLPPAGVAGGEVYTYSTTGVFQCWRGDISKVRAMTGGIEATPLSAATVNATSICCIARSEP